MAKAKAYLSFLLWTALMAFFGLLERLHAVTLRCTCASTERTTGVGRAWVDYEWQPQDAGGTPLETFTSGECMFLDDYGLQQCTNTWISCSGYGSGSGSGSGGGSGASAPAGCGIGIPGYYESVCTVRMDGGTAPLRLGCMPGKNTWGVSHRPVIGTRAAPHAAGLRAAHPNATQCELTNVPPCDISKVPPVILISLLAEALHRFSV